MSILPDTQLYIDGKLRPAASGRTFDNVSPWTGEVIGHSADAAPADVEEAIAAARRAFDTSDWSSNHEKRYALIKQFRDAFRASRDKLVLIARHEAGAALGNVGRTQVDLALNCFDELIKLIPQITYERDMGTRELVGTFHKRKVLNEAAGVVCADTQRAIRIANRIRTGTISVNGGMCIAGDLPFGGYKSSGIGRAWGIEGIEEYFEKKALAWRVPGPQ